MMLTFAMNALACVVLVMCFVNCSILRADLIINGIL